MLYNAGNYDVIVIGAGHAGCEAALASARLGQRTLLVTLNIDSIALMPCNPSIGGPAKAQLVREIDALGGEMALNIDKSSIQMRMLNTGKGPAVRALRAQADKKEYQTQMTRTLQRQENLDLVQAEVDRIECNHGRITGVCTRTGARFNTQALIVTTGTYLKGRIIVGDLCYEGGPNGLFAARGLSDELKKLGLILGRFKTGTPPRVHARSINVKKMIEQPGDPGIQNLSYMSPKQQRLQISCWLTHSNPRTHQIVRDNLHRSPLFSGVIKGVGPRRCPSFEDKVVHFADKDSHQIFLEPEGRYTDEMYVQGMNTSLPEDVQLEVLHSIQGLENCRIIRTGYAIEYDYVIPSQLKLSLECRTIEGLFTAGQINGTSGYEEAAAQGLIAGINADRFIKGKEPLILKRSEAYIGVLIDDLVTKGIDEPYRLMPTFAEYRLLLRQDNADQRLTHLGYEIGLVSEERLYRLEEKIKGINELTQRLKKEMASPEDEKLRRLLRNRQSGELREKTSLWFLLRRPEIGWDDLVDCGYVEEDGDEEIIEQIQIQGKYEGYIKKQLVQLERFENLEDRRINEEIDYQKVPGLSDEGRYKLAQIQPLSVGQASRITGVSPADINILLVYLERINRNTSHE